MIGAWIKNDEERKIALSTSSANKLSALNKEGRDKLISVLGAWRYYVGVRSDASPEELIVLAKYVCDTYGDLTIEEIELASNLSIQEKLDLDESVKPYGNLSVIYVSSVLNSFKRYRSAVMHRVLEEREKHMLELDKERKRTPDYKLQQFKDLFVIEYDNYLKDMQCREFLPMQ